MGTKRQLTAQISARVKLLLGAGVLIIIALVTVGVIRTVSNRASQTTVAPRPPLPSPNPSIITDETKMKEFERRQPFGENSAAFTFVLQESADHSKEEPYRVIVGEPTVLEVVLSAPREEVDEVNLVVPLDPTMVDFDPASVKAIDPRITLFQNRSTKDALNVYLKAEQESLFNATTLLWFTLTAKPTMPTKGYVLYFAPTSAAWFQGKDVTRRDWNGKLRLIPHQR